MEKKTIAQLLEGKRQLVSRDETEAWRVIHSIVASDAVAENIRKLINEKLEAIPPGKRGPLFFVFSKHFAVADPAVADLEVYNFPGTELQMKIAPEGTLFGHSSIVTKIGMTINQSGLADGASCLVVQDDGTLITETEVKRLRNKALRNTLAAHFSTTTAVHLYNWKELERIFHAASMSQEWETHLHPGLLKAMTVCGVDLDSFNGELFFGIREESHSARQWVIEVQILRRDVEADAFQKLASSVQITVDY